MLSEKESLSTPTFFQLQEEERYRMARVLMNGPGQILANTTMELEHALALLDTNPDAARAGLAALRDEVREGLNQLKAYVAELQPPLLEEMGLGPSLNQYVAAYGARNGIAVECIGCDALHERLPSTIETALFRIVQEALANVLQHSGATRVRVQIEQLAKQLQVQVEDNGRGFQNAPGGARRRQLGLVAMQDRAQLIGGHLQIFSEAGKGLRVVVTVPYHGQSNLAAGGPHEDRRENQNGQNAGARKKANALSTETGK
ncbi:MAG: sensor histidine kinase [Anaerolineae bacterium]